MPQKYGHLANAAVAPHGLACQLCGDSSWSWTDLHGEAYCTSCGSAHMIVGEAEVGKWRVREEYRPVFRKYWKVTGKRSGGGTFMLGRDYEEEIEDREACYKWMKENYPDWQKGAPEVEEEYR